MRRRSGIATLPSSDSASFRSGGFLLRGQLATRISQPQTIRNCQTRHGSSSTQRLRRMTSDMSQRVHSDAWPAPRLLDRRSNGTLNAMHRLLWAAILISVPAHAQSVENATELFQKARAFGESTKSWRAEVVETSRISGRGMNLHSEVRTRIAAHPPLKMSRQNSGSDRTVFICDGVETFYSVDGHSYDRGEARVTPQCDLPLSKFYELDDNPVSISFVGRDKVRLADGDRPCVVIRATWKQGTLTTARTMCIDPAQPLILRDVVEREDEKTGMRAVNTITFTEFESNPAFPPDTFHVSAPLGAVEGKPPA